MKIELNGGFNKRLNGKFGKFDFQVGILDDGPHKDPKRGERGKKGKDVQSTYAGGPIRKKTRESSISIAGVGKELRENTGHNWLKEPFENKRNADVLRFTKEFFKLVFGRSQKKRAENLLQAVIRNPILRGDYGPQGELTTKIKGFDRPWIDTAQFFKGIVAKCKVGRRV